MRYFIVFIIPTVALFSALSAASGSPLKTGIEAEQNRIDMQQIKQGMEDCEVIKIMGYPYKREKHMIDREYYDIWYYLTKPVALGQSKLVDENFTPLIFQNGHLLGWGRLFYKHLLDIDNARELHKDEKRQQYTNDKEEWPSAKDHVILPPPKKEDKKPSKPEVKEPQKPTKSPAKTVEKKKAAPAKKASEDPTESPWWD